MILRNCEYSMLAERIRQNQNRIVIYGAGMIGQIVLPYFIEFYGLQEYLECYVDIDERKRGEKIMIGHFQYEIRHPDYLRTPPENMIVLISNSNFYPILRFLDEMSSLDEVEGYIIPLIQILELHGAKPPVAERCSEERLIPKQIHYCWFGKKEIPPFLVKCMDTWREKCPDYEIIRWDESNYDVEKFPYTREAYAAGRYGFVSDMARLDILYEYGGIYIDTDVYLIKGIDDLLYQKAFVGVEKWGNINTGGMAGAVPRHPMLQEMLTYRNRFSFLLEDGSFNTETNGLYETIPFIKHGMRVDNTLQSVADVTVYPSSFFHPYDYMSGEEQIETWTISRHCFNGGWMEQAQMEARENTREKYRQILERVIL